MTRPDRLIQITVVFLAVGTALAGNANGQTRSTDRFLRVPSSAYPTIQSAIDAAPNGMKIVVAPGTYSETLLVQGKIIHIRGSEDPSQTTIAGDRPRGIVPANAAVGLVNYKNGGGGTLYGFRLVGGDAGITGRGLRGDRAAGREALRLDIRNVEISGSGRGILWDSPAAIVVSNSKISDTWGNGVSLLQGLLKSSYLTIVDAGQVGIYVANADATFDNVVSGFNASAGFYIYKSHVFITDSSVFDNVVAGVWAVHSDLTAYGTSSYANKANDVHRFGDGWVILLSNANLDYCVGSANDRAGLSNFGGHVALSNSEFSSNAFDLEGEDVPANFFAFGDPASDTDFSFSNGGNNTCDGDECTVETTGVEAPAPVVEP